MTPREQDTIIAEWCEPKPTEERTKSGFLAPVGFVSPRGFWTSFARKFCGYEKIPIWSPKPFSTDLNAMAEALKVVKERGLGRLFITRLAEVTKAKWVSEGCDYPSFVFTIATATAPQRAEALCRVIDAEGER